MPHMIKVFTASAILVATTSLSAIAGGSTVSTGPTTPPPPVNAAQQTESGTVAAVRARYGEYSRGSASIGAAFSGP